MKKEEGVLVDENEFLEMSGFLEAWENDPQKMKQTFFKSN